jgi:hypothetical protein
MSHKVPMVRGRSIAACDATNEMRRSPPSAHCPSSPDLGVAERHIAPDRPMVLSSWREGRNCLICTAERNVLIDTHCFALAHTVLTMARLTGVADLTPVRGRGSVG